MQIEKPKLKNPPLPKIIVIVGPTASGKTALAIRLAKKFGGEIISADSRQVYRGMDIGTGKTPCDTNSKVKTQKSKLQLKNKIYISSGAMHHLIDAASPKKQFTVVRFQKLGEKAMQDISRRGKLPIICGGTGHYIDALVRGQRFPHVAPNKKLRAELGKKSVVELYRMLKKLDPRRAKTIDAKNPRRLIRALEIVITTEEPIPALDSRFKMQDARVLWLGLNPPKEKLYSNIHKRLYARMRQGMVDEVRRLKKEGISSKRLEAFGLEYRYINRYLEHQLSKKDMLIQLEREIRRYAKRQMTWFGRNKKICWMRRAKETEKLIKAFL